MDPWTGVGSAKEFADACTQIGGLFGPAPKGKDYSAVWETFYKPIGSEDCLYLNIWSPSPATAKLPVIVFIHGGSNVVGAAFDPLHVGGNLARSANAVVATVAYRLGVMGWFSHPAFNTGDPLRDSGNFAVLDLIQSLKFVKNNIAGFGGDPDNVTIMGHSAGSTNVNALVVSPLAAGLFHKAVSLSGGGGGSLARGGGEQGQRLHQRASDQGSPRDRQGVGGAAGSATAFGGISQPWDAAGTAGREGAVSSVTDTGHSVGDGSFAMNPDGTINKTLWTDFASRAIHEQAIKTKALAPRTTARRRSTCTGKEVPLAGVRA